LEIAPSDGVRMVEKLFARLDLFGNPVGFANNSMFGFLEGRAYMS